MSDETTLLPCPFCGAKPEIIADRVTEWALIEHNDGCLFPTFPKHEIRPYDWEAWNTRAELGSGTCKNIAPKYLDFLCSECGFVHYHSDENDSGDGNDWAFCPRCGRRIER